MFGLFKEKIEPIPDISVTELITLNERLDLMILQWVVREIGSGLQPNTKLAEIAIFNCKLFYSPKPHGIELRNFLSREIDVREETDFTFSRIQDLYVNIRLSFPDYYIKSIARRYIETLISLDYEVDETVVGEYEYGWLLPKIQHNIRYMVKEIVVPRNK